MLLSDGGGGGGGSPKPPKPPKSIRRPSSPATQLLDAWNATSSSSGSTSSTSSYVPPPQKILKASVVRKEPADYDITRNPWSTAFKKDNEFWANLLPKLRQNVGEEHTNTILSNLLIDRYDTYMNRLDVRQKNVSSQYQIDLNAELAAQDRGLDYDIPEPPKVKSGLGRSNSLKNLVETYAESVNPGMSEEVQDAYYNFYKYEMERNMRYRGDLRDFRGTLNTAYQDARVNSESQAAADAMDNMEKRDALVQSNLFKNAFMDPADVKKSDDGGDSDTGEDGDDDGGGGFLGKVAGVVSGPANFVLDAKDEVLSRIVGEAKDPMFWALDQISRPLYGVNNAHMAWAGEDKDDVKGSSNPLGAMSDFFLDGGLSGKGFHHTFDELVDDPGGVLGEVASEFGQGFMLEDKTMFGQVIARNAEADPAENFYDNKWYQGSAGFVGDAVGDPLNIIGLGIVTKPLHAVKAVKNSNEIMATARKSSELLGKATTEGIPAGTFDPDTGLTPIYDIKTKKPVMGEGPRERPPTPKEVYKMMVGDGNTFAHKDVAGKSQHVASLAESNANLEKFFYRLEHSDFSMDTTRLGEIAEVRGLLTSHKNALLKDFQGESVVEAMRRDLEIKVASGSEPASALDEFNGIVTQSVLEQKMIEAQYYYHALDKAARQDFGVTHTPEGYNEFPVGHKKPKGQVASEGDELNPGEITSKGGTRQVPYGTKRTAWQNVEREYAEKKALYEKTRIASPSAPLKKQRRVELAAYKAKMDRALAQASEEGGGSLSKLLPELANDYRFTPEQIDGLYKEADALASANPQYRKLKKRSLSMNALLGRENWGSETAYMQNSTKIAKGRVDRQKNQILSQAAMKILKAYAEKQPVVTDSKRAAEIKREIARLESKNATSGSVGHNIDTQEVINELQDELRSLRTFELEEQSRSLMNVPEYFLKGEDFDMDKLKQMITVDLRKGEITFNQLRVNPTLGNKDEAAWLWATDVSKVLQDTYDSAFQKNAKDARAWRKDLAEKVGGAANLTRQDHEKYSKLIKQAAFKSHDDAFRVLYSDMWAGNLSSSTYATGGIKVRRPLGVESSEKELFKAIKHEFGKKEAKLRMAKYTAQRTKNDDEIKAIDEQLDGLRTKWAKESARQEEILKEARAGRIVMSKRLHEEALLTAARLSVAPESKHLSLRVIGRDLSIPYTNYLFQAAEKASGFRLFAGVREAYAATFKAPSSGLPDELKLATARALGLTPIIIEGHVKDLKKSLGQVSENKRVLGWEPILNGRGNIAGEQPVQDAINEAFEGILPFFQGYKMANGDNLSVKDINQYLPEEFRLSTTYANKNGVDTVQGLVNAIRANKKVNPADRKQLRDPYRVAWALRIGIEQAQSFKAVKHTVNETFGVRNLKSGVKGAHPGVSELDAEFRALGWNTVERLGATHLFPPEVIPDIERMLTMLEPRNIHKFGQMTDRAVGYWKTMTTLYNPGYWTRNGIGEMMSAWLGGVNHPKYYKKAFDVVKYARGDGKELDALKNQFPMLSHVKSGSSSGRKTAGYTKDGRPFSNEQVWVAYHDQGLKTGFFNTEFDAQYSRVGDKLRSTGGTKGIANTHQKVRNAGEWYEDGLRMAHFIHAIEHSGKGFEEAIKHAAKQVKKYHFDYSDFSNFEKTVMLRAFPFYKFTRKSLPLMTTMLFTKPGKVMLYPKAMNAVQGITTGDIAGDDNGFAPNYGDLVPGWMQDMWGYQVAGEEGMGEGPASYLNVATPQMDALKVISSPGPTGYGLLNPLIKSTLEIGQVITGNGDNQSFLQRLMGNVDFNGEGSMKVDLQSEDQNQGESIGNNLLRTTPIGNLFSKTGVLDGEEGMELPSDQELLSFGTGFGVYRNDDNRRKGVLYNEKAK